MLRKHPDVLALLAIGFALFANFGVQAAVQGFERDRLRVRELIQVERPRLDPVREGILILRDTLRCLRP